MRGYAPADQATAAIGAVGNFSVVVISLVTISLSTILNLFACLEFVLQRALNPYSPQNRNASLVYARQFERHALVLKEPHSHEYTTAR